MGMIKMAINAQKILEKDRDIVFNIRQFNNYDFGEM